VKIINFLTSILFFSAYTPVQGQIIINEVFPAPEQGNEWIELYNSSDQEIDLNDWLLEDMLSSPSIIAHIQNQTILSQSFLTIELTSAKLNNSADGVILKNSVAEVIDQMSYESSEAGLSWSKNDSSIFELAQPTKNTANVFPSPSISPILSPSPSPTINPSPSPTPAPSDTSFHQFITITEFLACPATGEKEWIKLHNSDSQSHSISSWKIRDISNQTRQLSATLVTGEYKIISWSGSLLNNSGDEFNLENELGESLQNIKYEACQTDTPNLASTTTTTTSSVSAPSPSAILALASPAIIAPPSSPPIPNSPQQLIINYDSTPSANKNQLTKIVTPKLPKEALLSVILGGSWLLFSSSWKIHEKITQHSSAS
jgi:hypothetical protein